MQKPQKNLDSSLLAIKTYSIAMSIYTSSEVAVGFNIEYFYCIAPPANSGIQLSGNHNTNDRFLIFLWPGDGKR
jgi:hypothetical protein